jgi:sugar fermentation stimulation protein A
MPLYNYPPLHSGTLVRRYKRFFAEIELDNGELITAHCPNTGPMTGVCQIGAPVQVSYNDNPKRKLRYTWEMIEVESLGQNQRVWVGINTALPNKLVKIALEQHLFPELPPYQFIRSEVVYGQNSGSRVDFVLEGEDCITYVEVKNTTWTIDDIAVFPDTQTTRGQKHLRELTDILTLPPTTQKHHAVMLYFINRGDMTKFSPGDTTDPLYGQLLRTAIAGGLQVLPCRFEVTPIGVEYLGLAQLILPEIELKPQINRT